MSHRYGLDPTRVSRRWTLRQLIRCHRATMRAHWRDLAGRLRLAGADPGPEPDFGLTRDRAGQDDNTNDPAYRKFRERQEAERAQLRQATQTYTNPDYEQFRRAKGGRAWLMSRLSSVS